MSTNVCKSTYGDLRDWICSQYNTTVEKRTGVRCLCGRWSGLGTFCGLFSHNSSLKTCTHASYIMHTYGGLLGESPTYPLPLCADLLHFISPDFLLCHDNNNYSHLRWLLNYEWKHGFFTVDLKGPNLSDEDGLWVVDWLWISHLGGTQQLFHYQICNY